MPASDDTIETALRILTDARAVKRPWTEIAAALLQLEGSGALDENGRPWIQRAEAESTITTNLLRRMTRAHRFVTEMNATEPELAQKLEWRKFTLIEIIAKIFAADREAAIQIINENPPGSSFRQLLAKLEDVKQSGATVSPQSAGKMAAKNFVKQCRLWLDGPGNTLLSGRGQSFHLVCPTLPLHFANPDFLLFQTQGDRIVAVEAIDCYAFHGDVDQVIVERRAVQVAAEATFFDRFLILLPPGSAARHLQTTIDWFGLTNVAVALGHGQTNAPAAR